MVGFFEWGWAFTNVTDLTKEITLFGKRNFFRKQPALYE